VTISAYASNSIGNSSSYQFDEQLCMEWPTEIDEIDTDMKIVRASGIAAYRLGFVVLLLLVTQLVPEGCLSNVQQKRFRFITISLIAFIKILHGLTFSIFKSSFCTENPFIALYGLEDTYPNDCEWGRGASDTILSMMEWFLAMLLLTIVKPLKTYDEETMDGVYRIQTEPTREFVQPARPVAQLAQ
jgi:hypothetical protein